MDLATQLAHLRADSDALLAACLADPAAPVPSCPGWDRTALLSHVGRIHRWAGGQLVCGPGERIRINEVSAPEGADLTAEYATGADQLIGLLTAMDLAATWPTWAGPQPGTFFPRRMTQELLIHRRDADPAPIDPALGVDGVDEMLELFAPRIPADRFDGRRGSVHLHATDADGEWLIQVAPDGITFEHGHAKGDVAVRGCAGDLLLWVWNRAQLDDRFEVFGDATLLDLWRQAVTF